MYKIKILGEGGGGRVIYNQRYGWVIPLSKNVSYVKKNYWYNVVVIIRIL